MPFPAWAVFPASVGKPVSVQVVDACPGLDWENLGRLRQEGLAGFIDGLTVEDGFHFDWTVGRRGGSGQRDLTVKFPPGALGGLVDWVYGAGGRAVVAYGAGPVALAIDAVAEAAAGQGASSFPGMSAETTPSFRHGETGLRFVEAAGPVRIKQPRMGPRQSVFWKVPVVGRASVLGRPGAVNRLSGILQPALVVGPWHEAQRGGVDAIPQAGGAGTVGKDMPKVAATDDAVHFGADHAVAAVDLLADEAGLRRLGERRPAGAGVVLVPAVKERSVAADAEVNPVPTMVPEGIMEWPFRSVLPGDAVLLLGEKGAPLGIAALHPPLAVVEHDRRGEPAGRKLVPGADHFFGGRCQRLEAEAVAGDCDTGEEQHGAAKNGGEDGGFHDGSKRRLPPARKWEAMIVGKE